MPKYTLLIAPSQAQGWREQVAAVEELFDFVAAVWIDPAGLAELFDSEMAVWIDPAVKQGSSGPAAGFDPEFDLQLRRPTF